MKGTRPKGSFYEGTKKIAVGGGMVFKMAAWITANPMMVNAVRIMWVPEMRTVE